MKTVIAILVLFFTYSPLAFSMHLFARPAYALPKMRFPPGCRFAHSKVTTTLIESIRCDNKKEISSKFFNYEVSTTDLLKVIKKDLYETGNCPHVDPTSGEPGYCQLIAGFLNWQINELKQLDLETCDEEATRPLLPLVKAYILQEFHNPKNYEALSAKSVTERIGNNLLLLEKEFYDDYLAETHLAKRKKDTFSNRKADILIDATQHSFKKDLFTFTGTTKDTAREESMSKAMDIFHDNDCLIYLRYYNGTPDRADIFSSIGVPLGGHLYKRLPDNHKKWLKLTGPEIAKRLHEDDRTNIIQVHFEYQHMLYGWHETYGLDQKPEIKHMLDIRDALGQCYSIPDCFGFGASSFDLSEFVMRGIKALNDPQMKLTDTYHPISTPCHFSVIPGIKNLARLISLTLCDDKDLEKGVARIPSQRQDFSGGPLRIQRYIDHWRCPGVTWVLLKKHKGIEVEIGLSEMKNSEHIRPGYLVLREDIGPKTVTIRDPERAAKIYDTIINTVIRPLTKAGYLYPQARFLLKEAGITEETIDQMLAPHFKDAVINSIRS